jgi:hypothetical protein
VNQPGSGTPLYTFCCSGKELCRGSFAGHHGLAGTATAAVSHGYAVASIWAAATLALAALAGGALITTRPGRPGNAR